MKTSTKILHEEALHEWSFDWPVPGDGWVGAETDEIVALGRLFAKAGYLPAEGKEKVSRSVALCLKAHRGQRRASGESYAVHPIEVACILAEKRMDCSTLSAALLHDVLEDSEEGEQEVERVAGEKAVAMVKALSKIEKLNPKMVGGENSGGKLSQAQLMRKMLMAMGKDIRVILVKLADRLHNMRTLSSLRPEKAKRIARETREIYAPLASRLGMEAWRKELEDLAFRTTNPWRERILGAALADFGKKCTELTKSTELAIKENLEKEGIFAKVESREKNAASLYQKMKQKRLSFDEVRDKLGVRIIVENRRQCYAALGMIHEIFKPMPGEFKDYVAIPKANGYQALHTTVLTKGGVQAEIQIRTEEMHQTAEEGVCSHWAYKEGDGHADDKQTGTYAWLSSLMEINAAAKLPEDFLDAFKGDLFSDEIYVFTPKGDCVALPRGATGIDFAYAIHSDIGDRLTGIVIDGRETEPKAELASGSVAEIKTGGEITVKAGWLGRAVTGRARAHIREALRKQSEETAEEIGRGALDWALRWMGKDTNGLTTEVLSTAVKRSGCASEEEMFRKISTGDLSARAISALCAKALASSGDKSVRTLRVRGDEGGWMRLAECCCPMPPSEIVGVIDAKKGLSIHRKVCRKIARRSPLGLMPMEWAKDAKIRSEARIEVRARSERGVLAKIAGTISAGKLDIASVEASEKGMESRVFVMVRAGSEIDLDSAIEKLREKSWCISAKWRRNAPKFQDMPAS